MTYTFFVDENSNPVIMFQDEVKYTFITINKTEFSTFVDAFERFCKEYSTTSIRPSSNE